MLLFTLHISDLVNCKRNLYAAICFISLNDLPIEHKVWSRCTYGVDAHTHTHMNYKCQNAENKLVLFNHMVHRFHQCIIIIHNSTRACISIWIEESDQLCNEMQWQRRRQWISKQLTTDNKPWIEWTNKTKKKGKVIKIKMFTHATKRMVKSTRENQCSLVQLIYHKNCFENCLTVL